MIITSYLVQTLFNDCPSNTNVCCFIADNLNRILTLRADLERNDKLQKDLKVDYLNRHEALYFERQKILEACNHEVVSGSPKTCTICGEEVF